jgi:NAD(P)H-hydrate epimerase
MKVLSARQIRELDAFTIRHEPVASIDLMERAAIAFTQWFTEKFHAGLHIGIVCGKGNNGGDGMAIARLLKDYEYRVQVWSVGSNGSPDYLINRSRVPQAISVTEVDSPLPANVFDGVDVLVDALFGTGLSRPVEGLLADTIQKMNDARAIRVAVDVPSGLMTDEVSDGAIVKADCTVSFQLPKLAFFQPSNHLYVGEWTLVNIGLHKGFIRESDTDYHWLQLSNVRKLLRPLLKFGHKGDHGRALLVAGSEGKMGAAVLASRAAIRSGLGLLTVHVPVCGYTVVHTTTPEAMVRVDKHERLCTSVGEVSEFDAIGVGPGMGQDPATAAALSELMTRFGKPVVLDADALNIIASHPELSGSIPADSILTPHPGEFRRLVGTWSDDFHKLQLLKDLARRLKSSVVLKGAYSAICSPTGEVFFNSTGNPGMAKGGSGDALTGLLTGLLAQGYDPLVACKIGVYVHGLAGDLALRDRGYEGMIPSDLIDKIPVAYQQVRKQ